MEKEHIITRIMMLTGWKESKAEDWYLAHNKNLANLSPAALVLLGQGIHVLNYIKELEEKGLPQ